MPDLISTVTATADAAGLHAPAPSLLLELQTLLGELAAAATESTEHGRRPFRAGPQWETALGAVGFAIYNLADQTGIDLPVAILTRAARLRADMVEPRDDQPGTWPFDES